MSRSKKDDTFYNLLTIGFLLVFLQVVFLPAVIWIQYFAVAIVAIALINNYIKHPPHQSA